MTEEDLMSESTEKDSDSGVRDFNKSSEIYSRPNKLIILVVVIIVFLGVLGAGFWWWFNEQDNIPEITTNQQETKQLMQKNETIV